MEYKATTQARSFLTKDYADYIQATLEDYVARGIHTEEYAQNADLGDLLAGNDGE